jgi:hypothetical protein
MLTAHLQTDALKPISMSCAAQGGLRRKKLLRGAQQPFIEPGFFKKTLIYSRTVILAKAPG